MLSILLVGCVGPEKGRLKLMGQYSRSHAQGLVQEALLESHSSLAAEVDSIPTVHFHLGLVPAEEASVGWDEGRTKHLLQIPINSSDVDSKVWFPGSWYQSTDGDAGPWLHLAKDYQDLQDVLEDSRHWHPIRNVVASNVDNELVVVEVYVALSWCRWMCRVC